MTSSKEIQELRGQVLDWYDAYGRELPWRYKNDKPANPYHVWLSEIMCQQTTVQAVIPYYTKFLSSWPTIQSLANAPRDDILSAWAGLGYYARARNLHKCANVIANDLNGEWPKTAKELKALPGVGDYTAAAIATIVFNEAATVMDGNIERIMARFFEITNALPKAKPVFKTHTSVFFESFTERHGDFAQALMDIGSSICTPKNPKCDICPLNNGCSAFASGAQTTLPVKTKKKPRPHKFGEVYWITNGAGQVLFHRRPEKGLLAGMIALPTTSWEEKESLPTRPAFLNECQMIAINTPVTHVFTHFDLTLTLKTIMSANDIIVTNDYFWTNPIKEAKSLPTVFRKAEKIFASL